MLTKTAPSFLHLICAIITAGVGATAGYVSVTSRKWLKMAGFLGLVHQIIDPSVRTVALIVQADHTVILKSRLSV